MHLTPRQHLAHQRYVIVGHFNADITPKLIQLARKAGAAYGSTKADKAYAELVLMDELTDTEREQLGFATHKISQCKAGGHTSSEVWHFVHESLRDHYGRSLKTMDDDAVKIGVLAYSAGMCQDNPKVSATIQRYLNGVVTDGDALTIKHALAV